MNICLRPILLALLTVTTANPGAAQCWVISPLNGHAYRLSRIGTWKQAQTQARAFGGNLATVRSQAENAWLVKTFKPASGTNWLWIGFTDEVKEGTWVWASGEKPAYTNWCRGEPNNANGDEDYCHFNDATGCWNDAIANGQMAGIIEVAPTSSTKATFKVLGQGCGSVPTQLPTLSSNTLPIIGCPFSLQLRGLRPGSVGILAFGNSATSWNGVPLPLNLRIIGMPGCTLYVSYDYLVPITTGSGSLDWDTTVPPDVKLLGIPFHTQAWHIDRNANPLGIGITNAGSARIGL